MSDREDDGMANGGEDLDSRSPARSRSLSDKPRSASPARSMERSRSRSPIRSPSRDRSLSQKPSLSRSPVARGVSRSRSRERSLSPRRRSLSPRERRRRSPSPYERRRSPPPRRYSPSPRRYRSRSRDRGYGGYGGYGRRRSPPRYRSPMRRRSPYGGGYGRRRTPPPPRRRRTPPATGLHLFVAGLNFSTTEKEVQRKFEKYGDVTLSRIVRNPVNGESRGFGFVDMKDDEGADEAIQALDGEEWHGRRLLVERARNVR